MRLYPNALRRVFESWLDPLIRFLTHVGVNPNTLTTLGTFVLLGSGTAFGLGRPRLGGLLLLLSGVFDMLDGRVARRGAKVTKFGAFYDSTLDRVGESALLGGIAVFFVSGGVPARLEIWALGIGILAVTMGLTVSYARARAEGLGLDCRVGIAQRAERILGLGVPTLFFGAGPDGLLLLGIVAVLALLSSVTVVQRILHVYKNTRPVEAAPGEAGRSPESRPSAAVSRP